MCDNDAIELINDLKKYFFAICDILMKKLIALQTSLNFHVKSIWIFFETTIWKMKKKQSAILHESLVIDE